MLVADLYHVDLAVQAQIGAGHGERSAPLAGSGLGGDTLEALLLCVVRLCDGGVQLMGAGGVVALKFVVDFCRGLKLFLQTVGPHQGRGAVHLVKVPNLLGNGDLPGVVVQLLADQLVAEHGTQVVKAHGSAGAGIQQRGGLVLHIGPDVIPGFRHLILGEIDFVGDFRLGFHSVHSFQKSAFSKGCVKKRPSSLEKEPVNGSFGTKALKLLRCHPNWR